MHATERVTDQSGSPTTDRAAAIRQSLDLYCATAGLSPEHTDEVITLALDVFGNGDSAAWAIAVGRSRAQELAT